MKTMKKEAFLVVAVSAVAIVAGAWQVAGKRAPELPAPYRHSFFQQSPPRDQTTGYG